MERCARAIVYWPGMSEGIRATRYRCADCNRNAPSHTATPPLPSSPPSTPFEAVFAYFFDYGGRHYLVVGDCLSGWVEVLCSTAGTDMGGSAGLVHHLRSFFGSFGIPEELSSDGGPEFMAGQTQDFLRLWNVEYRVSSVAFPQSNGRAEVAVKTAKRLLMSNTGPTGSLDHDRFLRAMIQLRNTPDPDCSLSPAQIVYGRPLRGSLSFATKLEKFSDSRVRPLWRQAWAAKEDALRTRMSRTAESLRTHSRPLCPLAPGTRVFLQNQQGPSPNKWDRSGVVVESLGHDQYRVKVDGSGRLTLRNRRFLRGYTPATPYSPLRPVAPLPPPVAPDCQPLPVRPCPATTHDAGLGPSLLLPSDGLTSGLGSGSSPPLPSDEVTSDLRSQGYPVPSGVVPPASPRVARSPPPPPPPLSAQPCRSRRPPKHYEPETGRWVVN
ncbi:uncharacterized protein [Antennarius striatus]|uniref:uncharacterized protein n=1 Tax=Antennarius striatus TaxID=241820 RepID=UPI0035B27177